MHGKIFRVDSEFKVKELLKTIGPTSVVADDEKTSNRNPSAQIIPFVDLHSHAYINCSIPPAEKANTNQFDNNNANSMSVIDEGTPSVVQKSPLELSTPPMAPSSLLVTTSHQAVPLKTLYGLKEAVVPIQRLDMPSAKPALNSWAVRPTTCEYGSRTSVAAQLMSGAGTFNPWESVDSPTPSLVKSINELRASLINNNNNNNNDNNNNSNSNSNNINNNSNNVH